MSEVIVQGKAYCEACNKTRVYVKNVEVSNLRCPVCGGPVVPDPGDRGDTPYNPTFRRLLQQMDKIHERKGKDYARKDNVYSNFEIAGTLGRLFTDPQDVAFATLIGVKIARLAELKGKGKQPHNESVADTHLDMATYAGLWAAWEADRE